MNNAKISLALLAACILIMPAFSMPDDGNPAIGHDCKQIQSMMPPEGCPCPNPAMAPNGEHCNHISSMMGNGAQPPEGCPCPNPAMAPNGEDGPQKTCHNHIGDEGQDNEK